MKRNYLKSGLKLLAIISLLSASALAQNRGLGDLSGKRWELVEIGGKRVYGSKAFLEIASSQTRFSGNAGCNRMFGSVTLSGRNISFGNVGTTRMFCNENGAMKLEADFTRALERVTRFEKSGNNLSFFARNRLVLKFKGTPPAAPDDDSAIKLENKKWVLESIKNRRLPEVETEAFINFDKAKGGAGGNTSCNVFGGDYSTRGDTFSFTQGISTMRACIEDERMTIERSFLDGLRDANRVEIVGGKLNLYRNKTLLLTFRAENK
jgi:heat shock protein HslJ